MARLYNKNNPDKTYEESKNIVDAELLKYGVVPTVDYMASARSATNQIFFTLDPKLTLTPICDALGFDKFEIAKEMHADEIFEDAKTMVNAVIDFIG